MFLNDELLQKSTGATHYISHINNNSYNFALYLTYTLACSDISTILDTAYLQLNTTIMAVRASFENSNEYIPPHHAQPFSDAQRSLTQNASP